MIDAGGEAGERMHMNSDIANCKQFEKFLRLVTKTNILTVQRKRFTWMVSYKDAEGRLSQVYWQFSLKEPWLIPHFDDGTSGPRAGRLPLYGWLFFYFGKNTSISLTENGNPRSKSGYEREARVIKKNNYSS